MAIAIAMPSPSPAGSNPDPPSHRHHQLIDLVIHRAVKHCHDKLMTKHAITYTANNALNQLSRLVLMVKWDLL